MLTLYFEDNVVNRILHYNRSRGGAVGRGAAVQTLRSGSIPDGVFGIFHLLNYFRSHCGRNLTEISTKDISCG